MIIASIRHRGLRRFIESGDARFLPPDLVNRIRVFLSAVGAARDLEQLITEGSSGWRIHQLAGDRRGEWSVTISGNCRITFEYENGVIDRLNLEDYH